MKKYRVLLLGGGGREHAIAWKLSQSEKLDKLFIAPGNPGTGNHGENVSIDNGNHDDILRFVRDREINLVIVGPEQPLVDGIADFLKSHNIPVFGPDKAAARLEGSKEFAKKFMSRYSIPTAAFNVFDSSSLEEAMRYIMHENRYPVVLKADGLAGGKGVFICENERNAREKLNEIKTGELLPKAASTLVIEEFMTGEEASVFVITDGNNSKIIHHAQDHKRIGDGDTGPNTGGMGAYSPATILSDSMMERIQKEIIDPTISGMRKEGSPYTGILYVGLMMTEEGPKVVEYNCRFGDPECQVILPPLENDLLELINSTVNGELESVKIQTKNVFLNCVVMASKGYPLEYETGKEITGLETIDKDCIVFQAGTKKENDHLLTDGGRVLTVVGRGNTLQEAIDHSYKNVDKINFSNVYYRKDIGKKGL